MAKEHSGRYILVETVIERDGCRDVWISTGFLGLDHPRFDDNDRRPVLWETMVFGLPRHPEPQWRYASAEEALTGHEAAVLYATRVLDNPDAPGPGEGEGTADA